MRGTRVLWLIVGLLACDPSAARLFYDGVSPPDDTGAAGGGGHGGSSSEAGGGSMVECAADNDCPPGPTAECSRSFCFAGMCRVEMHPNGFILDRQTAGDCSRLACDGFGNIRVEVDPTDIIPDNNPCTVYRCVGLMAPSPMPSDEDTPCPGGRCDGKGLCMPDTCHNGMMDGAEVDVDCGGPYCAPCHDARQSPPR